MLLLDPFRLWTVTVGRPLALGDIGANCMQLPRACSSWVLVEPSIRTAVGNADPSVNRIAEEHFGAVVQRLPLGLGTPKIIQLFGDAPIAPTVDQ